MRAPVHCASDLEQIACCATCCVLPIPRIPIPPIVDLPMHTHIRV